MKRSTEMRLNEFAFIQNKSKKPAMDLKDTVPITKTVAESSDRKHLGGENFVSVNHFLGQTRVHIRRYVRDDDGELHPTKDGVSLTPIVWHFLCAELRFICNDKSPEKMFVIKKDLCISKQLKDGANVYVFQRLFQRKNLSMQFIPEFVVLQGAELGKLYDSVSVITDCVKDSLVTYSLEYCIAQELKNPSLGLNPVDKPDPFLDLMDSLRKCLTVSLTLKIAELLKCFGCREFYDAKFMHDCYTISRSEKWSENFDQALFSIDMRDIAKDIVKKNLTLDFDLVLGQQEFFDAIDVKKLFESIQQTYVGEEVETMSDDVSFSCSNFM